MSTPLAFIDPDAAPRARDRLLCQWAGPFFRGACDFLYEPVKGNRATWGGTAAAARWRPDGQFFLVPEFGTGSYALARNSGSEQALTDITVSGWLNRNTVGSSVILGTILGPAQVRLSHILGTLRIDFDGGTTSFGPVVLTVGQWYHFAATCDSAGNAALYLDGVQVASNTGQTFTYPLTQPPALGGDNNNGVPSGSFNGRLFDVRLYARALFADEIRDTANAIISQRLFSRPAQQAIPPVPTLPPPNPLLGEPPFFRTVVSDQSYTYVTSPLVFEQLYNERWDIVASANPLTAEITKNVAGTLVTISKTAIYGNVVPNVPAIWFDLTAAETAGMALGEWKGELIGVSSGTVEVFRKFSLLVRS